jgi:hypothetical protein
MQILLIVLVVWPLSSLGVGLALGRALRDDSHRYPTPA